MADATFTVDVLERGSSAKAIFKRLVPIAVASYCASRLSAPALAILPIMLVALGLVVSRVRSSARKVRTTLRITKEDVHVGERLPIRRADIAASRILAGDRPRLQLVGTTGAVLMDAELDDHEQVSAVLSTLDLASSKRATFDITSPFGGSVPRYAAIISSTLGVVLAAGVLAHDVGIASWVATLAFPLALAMATWPGLVTADENGVLVTWLWRQRFIPASEIRDVRADGRSKVGLMLDSGERLSLQVRSPAPDCTALAAQLRETVLGSRDRRAREDLVTFLARGTRSREEWVDTLRALRTNGYREVPVDDEDLLRVVEDPRAPDDARAGAAMLVRHSLDDGGKARVRVAAESTLSPHLRVALEATDEGVAAEALDELIEDERAAARR